jgi:predicted nucleic acid-binding protein
MLIFIDTNIIIQENYLRSVYAESFLKATRLLAINVLIPEIVLDEVRGVFSSSLKEKITAYENSSKDLGKLVKFKKINISYKNEINEFNNFFNRLLDKYKIEILPYPKTTSKKIIIESYKQKKPFRKKGDGYKDFLVWETIKETLLQRKNENDNYFLTNNTSDFCQKIEEKYSLHTDLSDRLPKSQNELKVYLNIKGFFSDQLRPRLKNINSSDIPDLDLEEITQNIMEENLYMYSAYNFEGLDFADEVTVDMVHEVNIEDIQLIDVDNNEILITITGSVLLEIDGFIEKHEYHGQRGQDRKKIYVSDYDWNERMMAVSSTINTPFELSLSYLRDSNEIGKSTINLPGEIHDDWPYK